MMENETLEKIKDLGLLAVIRASGGDEAEKIVGALVQGGVTGIELTFTTPDAPGVVKNLDKIYGERILLGMGTLTRPEQAAAAKDAGAKFLVSPHTEENLADAMGKTGLPFMMGALTPTEVVRANSLGCEVVKIFPGSVVGPGYIKSIRGPYPDIQVMPTGGVNLENLEDWFAAGVYAVGVGSALFPKQWVKEGRFDEITERAREYSEAIKRISHHQNNGHSGLFCT